MVYTKAKMILAIISILPVLLFFAILTIAKTQFHYELCEWQEVALFFSLLVVIGTIGCAYAYRMGQRLPNALWH